MTAPSPWACGARIALAAQAAQQRDHCPAYVRIRARANVAAVGIGVFLGISRLHDAGDLVVQTWSDRDSGTLHIEGIEPVVLVEPPVGAAAQ